MQPSLNLFPVGGAEMSCNFRLWMQPEEYEPWWTCAESNNLVQVLKWMRGLSILSQPCPFLVDSRFLAHARTIRCSTWPNTLPLPVHQSACAMLLSLPTQTQKFDCSCTKNGHSQLRMIQVAMQSNESCGAEILTTNAYIHRLNSYHNHRDYG